MKRPFWFCFGCNDKYHDQKKQLLREDFIWLTIPGYHSCLLGIQGGNLLDAMYHQEQRGQTRGSVLVRHFCSIAFLHSFTGQSAAL